MKDRKTGTSTIQEMTMTRRTSRQRQRAARQGRTTLRQKKKAATQRRTISRQKQRAAKQGRTTSHKQWAARQGRTTSRQKQRASTEMINEQGGEFPFAMGSEFPRNEVKMIISQRTETGIQTSETEHKSGRTMGKSMEEQQLGKTI